VPEQRGKRSKPDVRAAITPHRLTISAWAFAAIVFGSAGFAAYQLGGNLRTDARQNFAGVRLPPSGPVTSTGTIEQQGDRLSVGILPSPEQATAEENDRLRNSQIETLQREVVQLRRRLSGLSEQNRVYSKRLANLEAALVDSGSAPERPKSSASLRATPNPATSPIAQIPAATPQPVPERSLPVSSFATTPDSGMKSKTPVRAVPLRPSGLTTGQPDMPDDPSAGTDPAEQVIETLPAPETVSTTAVDPAALPENPDFVTAHPQPKPDMAHRPVRIVEAPRPLPAAPPEAEPELVTGSINPLDGVDEPPVQPEPIRPGEASGRTSARGNATIDRTDFGVIVGRFPTEAAAADAWLSFKEKNEERMTDLRPVVAPSEQEAGMVNLMAGPFPNAADAAVACLRLLEVSGTCHPALYVGDALKLP